MWYGVCQIVVLDLSVFRSVVYVFFLLEWCMVSVYSKNVVHTWLIFLMHVQLYSEMCIYLISKPGQFELCNCFKKLSNYSFGCGYGCFALTLH